ncbi:hypothetical protein CCYA_CCYA04G1286 [Cyanidiococcus yangmingshanensis]|nr:hypothetical protein CCYA_CCYA04G1286 [Cyanidiococcus yangmingshanensis]
MSKFDAAAAPLDARTLASILSSMGIEDYEDRVIHQLLELLYRYMAEVLADARDVAEHARRGQARAGRTGAASTGSAAAAGDAPDIDVNDVKLAIELKLQREFVQPPPREVQMLHARELNAIPLPVFRGDRDTVELPPEELQLTAPVFRVVARRRKRTLEDKLPAIATDGAAYSTALAVSDVVQQRAADRDAGEPVAVEVSNVMETVPTENGNGQHERKEEALEFADEDHQADDADTDPTAALSSDTHTASETTAAAETIEPESTGRRARRR